MKTERSQKVNNKKICRQILGAACAKQKPYLKFWKTKKTTSYEMSKQNFIQHHTKHFAY